MDDETTTNAPDEQAGQSINGIAIDDQGMAIPQAEPSESAEAVEKTPEQQPAEETEVSEETNEPETTDVAADNSDFFKKKGIDPSDPEALTKLAKIAENAEKAMHRNAQQRSELEKAANIAPEQILPDATPEQRDNIRIRNIELKSDIREWKYQNQEKLEFEPQMVEILSDPNKRLMVQEGLLNLDDVYAMARGKGDTTSIKSQGGREALQKLAQKQQAAVPRGNAVTQNTASSKITAQNVDSMVANMSSEEYRRRLPEINRAMGG